VSRKPENANCTSVVKSPLLSSSFLSPQAAIASSKQRKEESWPSRGENHNVRKPALLGLKFSDFIHHPSEDCRCGRVSAVLILSIPRRRTGRQGQENLKTVNINADIHSIQYNTAIYLHSIYEKEKTTQERILRERLHGNQIRIQAGSYLYKPRRFPSKQRSSDQVCTAPISKSRFRT
jgi:hypothetical protein